MAHAYQQIPIVDNSKPYLTINTRQGLFVYHCLAFGVSSAPAIFQRVIKNVLVRIPRAVVYLDDILVTAASGEEDQVILKEMTSAISASMQLSS